MPGSQSDAPVLVALLTTDPPPAPLAGLDTLDDRLGVVSLPATPTTERLASLDPDCAVVVEGDRLSDRLAVLGAYDADLPVFVYRDDAPGSTPADTSVSPDRSGTGPASIPADTSGAHVAGVLTHSALADAGVPATAADHDSTEAGDTAAGGDGPVARLVAAVSDYWIPDDLRLRDVALDAVSVGVTISDPSKSDNPLVYANEQFTRITGYADHETLGRNCRFLQGPKTDPESVAEIRQAVEAGRPAFVDLWNYRKDGTPFRNELQILPITDDGEVVNFLGLQRDVTGSHRQTETETRLREIRREARTVAHDTDESPVARIESLLALGRTALDVENAHLVFVDPERDYHEIVRADGAATFERGETTALSESYCRHSLDGAESFAFHDPEAVDLADDPAHERHGMGCYLSEPVYRDGTLYGTLCFADGSPREAFGEAERQFAALLSAHVGGLLAQARDEGSPLRDERSSSRPE